MEAGELEGPTFEPDAEKLRSLTIRLQQTFGLDLFGIDVIVENMTGRYAIIDINTFPGVDLAVFCCHLSNKTYLGLLVVRQQCSTSPHIENLVG